MSEAIHALVYVDRSLGVISRYETAAGSARKTHTATEPDQENLPADINWEGVEAFRVSPPAEYATAPEPPEPPPAAPMPLLPGARLSTDWPPPESA